MKTRSNLIRNIAIVLCLPFLLGTITRCGCDGREIHKDLDTTRDYFEDPRRRPEGIEKYDDILYSFHKDKLDRLERRYLKAEPGSEERKEYEVEYWEYKYDLYSDWDKRIKLREIDGATREEAVKEVAIEQMIKEKTMNWDEAEEIFDEKWGYLFEDEPSGTGETTLEETAEETTEETAEETTEETTSIEQTTLEDWLTFLDADWEGDQPYSTEVDGVRVQGTLHGIANYRVFVEAWIGKGVPVTVDNDGDLVFSPAELEIGQFDGMRFRKIDNDHFVIIYPSGYDPNEFVFTRVKDT